MASASSSIPQEIKILLHDCSTHSLRLSSSATPVVSSTKHLIQVHTTGLTNNELTWPEPNSIPHPVPGFDVSGTILTSVEGSPFKPGDQVYALTAFDRPGAAREITEALPEELALKPKSLGWSEAASVPMSALTAWQALFVHGELTAPSLSGTATKTESAQGSGKKRVLITGASGAVGIWAVQLARLAGYYTIGTCGPKNVDFVRGLGASEVLDYSISDQGLKEWVLADPEQRKCDVVLDCVGGKILDEAWSAAREGGKVITLAAPIDEGKKPEGVEGMFFIVEPDGSMLRNITGLLEQGVVKTFVDSAWKFEEWEKAMDRVGSGRARGKVVLVVKE